ncbi:hypothetical protein PILCRDRAFT_822635 [Piloderma croceum F 1598]|uniref:Uncharacterized protein n=1 Tax=Piloderma croceum (strain F 1598) TaxID=765440 RepID=A0A0C3F699_PILCF|nr:hypothetical protein PILCRDRAFT_822635 [Piloderma croceum F 1598]
MHMLAEQDVKVSSSAENRSCRIDEVVHDKNAALDWRGVLNDHPFSKEFCGENVYK